MHKRRIVLFLLIFILISTGFAQQREQVSPDGKQAREYFVASLVKIAEPVLEALSKNELKKTMPVETTAHPWGDRKQVTYLEAFGRTLSGIAPWLELGPDKTEEGRLREKYIQLTLKSIHNATDPDSPDFMNFTEGGQPLVDAAFFAQGLLRAPVQLWEGLDKQTQANVLKVLKSTREISPAYSNWLLFTAMVEAALLKFEGQADMVRIEYALNKHKEWYLGDGMYGDGPDFHWDYYNSYVIQPMLLDIGVVLKETKEALEGWRYKAFLRDYRLFMERAQRYAAIQERLISPDGTYPPIGRSLPYRYGAFQALSQMALLQKLPDELNPAQVRSALYAVVKKHHTAPDMFDGNGWLTLGFYGRDPEIAEGYLSTGSLYLCTEVFLVLGLAPDTQFWTDPPANWTQKRIWNGEKVQRDHAYYPKKEQQPDWETVIDSTSFAGYDNFEKDWNYLYPWGNDHNGSARMYAGSENREQVTLNDGILQIKATPVEKNEGKSSKPPYQQISYHSGAVHAKHHLTISEEYPWYRVSGEFKAPVAKGTWPAFWLTAVDGWPPESDILEFKGDTFNWQNTFITPAEVSTIKKNIPDAMEKWHEYTAVLKRTDDEMVTIDYFIDGKKTGTHRANFTGKPLWLIINLQMEGSSGSPGPETETFYYARNVTVQRATKL
ncbi:DUF2264 domain-containing protein [Sinomicrobium weinanense]|uniref:DUF2264 domain-containing protein n=1 Tax=Sinomicrobium weinanense TaxID=2842200 RepID=A0A926JS12_9FLAO|nr:DUF2264 domain-containing protein [Sinomicrobium weinanense]MBC9796161.1 DUF2264 domain-containing protein [Sinomicrobium weinanense]MBU3121912.1 DUF2264 domain-containing protein [Sinomicrobium weinanense]